jgi:hypothetical protein
MATTDFVLTDADVGRALDPENGFLTDLSIPRRRPSTARRAGTRAKCNGFRHTSFSGVSATSAI